MPQEFFPERPDAKPTIYAYKLNGVETHKGWLKIGYTVRSAQDRIAQQLKTSRIKYDIVFVDSAMRNDGSSFTDHDIHRYLVKKNIKRVGGEWFKCTVGNLKIAILALKTGAKNEDASLLFHLSDLFARKDCSHVFFC